MYIFMYFVGEYAVVMCLSVWQSHSYRNAEPSSNNNFTSCRFQSFSQKLTYNSILKSRCVTCGLQAYATAQILVQKKDNLTLGLLAILVLTELTFEICLRFKSHKIVNLKQQIYAVQNYYLLCRLYKDGNYRLGAGQCRPRVRLLHRPIHQVNLLSLTTLSQ